MVELIAFDLPIAVVSRLIGSLNRLTTCSHCKDEPLDIPISRFVEVAADPVLHGVLSSSSQVGEVLPITLFNNSLLTDEKFTNAKLQLIALAEARMKKKESSGS